MTTADILTIHGRTVAARGNLDLLVTPGRVLITGSRASTPYGEAVATEAATLLAARGATIITSSGYGIDAAAVRGADPARTVLVQPAGIDKTYPRAGGELARRVETAGGLILAMPTDPAAAPTRWDLLDAAALRGAVAHHAIFVEGARRCSASGAALTCQSRWAVPGPITSATSALPNDLLRDGARLWTNDPADADVVATATNTSHPYRGEHADLLNHRAA